MQSVAGAQEFISVCSTGKEKIVKLKRSQLKASTLGKIFSLWPDSIFLLSEAGVVLTADDQGDFNIEDDNIDGTWSCEGDSSTCKPSRDEQYFYQLQPVSTKSSSSRRTRVPPPFIQHNTQKKSQKWCRPPGVARQEECHSVEWTKSIELYTYTDGFWEKFHNVPVRLSESCANVSHVRTVIGADGFFNGKEIVLLDVDFLEIPDIPATRGSLFWKSSAKKVKAVEKSQYCDYLSYKRKRGAIDDSLSKSKRSNIDFETRLKILEEKDKTDHLLAEANIAQLKLELSNSKDMISRITDCFRCLICMKCPAFPVYCSPCCEVILGCHGCVLEWLSESESCPHCRASLNSDRLRDLPVIRPLQVILSPQD